MLCLSHQHMNLSAKWNNFRVSNIMTSLTIWPGFGCHSGDSKRMLILSRPGSIIIGGRFLFYFIFPWQDNSDGCSTHNKSVLLVDTGVGMLLCSCWINCTARHQSSANMYYCQVGTLLHNESLLLSVFCVPYVCDTHVWVAHGGIFHQPFNMP